VIAPLPVFSHPFLHASDQLADAKVLDVRVRESLPLQCIVVVRHEIGEGPPDSRWARRCRQMRLIAKPVPDFNDDLFGLIVVRGYIGV
jgi:hypothetical protein